jgi:polysaccharide biosynthesis transport protein
VRNQVADFAASTDNDREVESASLGSWSREVWRRKRVVVAVILAAVLAALAVTALKPNTYSASADVKVSSGNISSNPQSGAEASYVLATQVQVLLSTQLRNDVAERLGDSVDIVDVSVEGVPESQVATITVEAKTAQGAADAANAFAVAYDERRDRGAVQEATSRLQSVQKEVDALTAQLTDLQAQVDAESNRVNLEQARITVARDNAARAGVALGPEDVVVPNTSALSSLQARYADSARQLSDLRGQLWQYQMAVEAGDGGVAIISTASAPAKPTGLGPVPTALLAALLGFGLGIGLALVLASRDQRLYDRRAVQALLPDVRVVGSAPSVGTSGGSAIEVDGLVLPSPHSGIVDAYREVALVAARAGVQDGNTKLLVAGAAASDTVNSAAGALAVAMAIEGRQIVVVDVCRPSGADAAESRHLGLTDVLSGAETLSSCLLPVEVPGGGSLKVLTVGRHSFEQSWFRPEKLGRLLASLTADADVVVVRGRPLLEGADALALVPQVDGVLLPVLLSVSKRSDVAGAMEKVAAVGGSVLGVVLHEAPKPEDAASTDRRAAHVRREASSSQTEDVEDERQLTAPRQQERNVSSGSRT